MTGGATTGSFPAPGHDHAHCIEQAIQRTEAAFSTRGMRLTPLRRSVFIEIASSHQALGAYEILERLSKKKGRLAPISVYRALEALLAAGAVHRLESRNAYFACHAAHHTTREPVILACRGCGRIAEVPGEEVFEAIKTAAALADFRPSSSVVEIIGLCAICDRTQEH